jgi:phytoene dehydrogenase-like protein
MSTSDAVVVGSGPNGLAAALVLAKAGLAVEVLEGAPTPGGGCRTEALTLEGYRHDTCSTIQALATISPFFRAFDLAAHGVTLKVPEVAFAHPLDGGRAAAVAGSVAETGTSLGVDRRPYERLMGPIVGHGGSIAHAALSPIRSLPRDAVGTARFGAIGARSIEHVAARFETPAARALFAGVGAHSMQPLSRALTGGFGLLLAMTAHAGGWPVVEGGSAGIVEALCAALDDAGASVRPGRWIRRLDELPAARVVLLDTSPAGLLAIAGDELAPRARRAFGRFRYGPGVCKVDWALSGPVPWAAEPCRRTATVHVGGTFEEVARAEAEVAAGRHPEQPFCIVVQPSVVDPTRAPAGHQTLWGYCHVPSGSPEDMTSRIEAQIERFAPGFSDLVLARSTVTAAELEGRNPNYVGGDVAGGAGTLRQTLFRPTLRWNNYRTGRRGLYLCSASTPPGGGVHGMCGVGAALTALRDLGIEQPAFLEEGRRC